MKILPVKREDLFELEEIESMVFDVDGFGIYILRQYLEDNLIFDKIIDENIPVRTIGFIICTEESNENDREKENNIAHIDNLAIMPEFQHRGYGSALLENSLIELRIQAFLKVRLEVKENNEDAIRFYENHGFKIIDLLSRYYASEASAFLMEKRMT